MGNRRAVRSVLLSLGHAGRFPTGSPDTQAGISLPCLPSPQGLDISGCPICPSTGSFSTILLLNQGQEDIAMGRMGSLWLWSYLGVSSLTLGVFQCLTLRAPPPELSEVGEEIKSNQSSVWPHCFKQLNDNATKMPEMFVLDNSPT